MSSIATSTTTQIETMPELHIDSRLMEDTISTKSTSSSTTSSSPRPLSASDFLLQQDSPVILTEYLRTPLPLQCLAAEALPDGVKQEIEQITNNSLREINQNGSNYTKGSMKDTNKVHTYISVKHYS